MKRREYKCSPIVAVCAANILSVSIIVGSLIATALAFIFDGFNDFLLVAKIVGLIIIGIWLNAAFSLLFRKRVVVTDDEISVYRWNKVKWRVNRNNIMELVFCNTLNWYMFVLPFIDVVEAPQFLIRLNNGKISEKYCCYLFLKNAKDIAETFGYALKIIGKGDK